MATIHIDGEAYEVDGASNLLEACLSLGLDVPYFCWHPAMGSVGSCRQCAVKQYKDADDKRGRIVMSCMTPASDGAYISIDDEEAKKFRQAIIEFLMLNHPHDCPVCEEGGNCHLQDMTVMSGHSLRKFRFNKKTHNNQDLGPFINHEMNRCIACYRCVRYYKDYAGGKDFGVFGAHDNVYFGRYEAGVLESEFSGNLIEVCPTGVFTDKTHSSRYNRKWDMQYAPSICQQCSVGCNISPGERYGELRRIENRYNGTVNHYFLCDRGRFGYGYVNLKDRPRRPRLLENGRYVEMDAQQAVAAAAQMMAQSKGVIAIGSARASVESNYALRALVGKGHFFAGLEAGDLERTNLMLQVLRESGVYTPSLREIEKYDAVLVLGEDVTQTGPRVALAIRQALKGRAREMTRGLAKEQHIPQWQTAAVQTIGQNERYPLFITSTDATRLDDVAQWVFYGSADEQAQLGFAIAHAIDPEAPLLNGAATGLTQEAQAYVQTIAQSLMEAKRPLVVTGSHAASAVLIQAAANVAMAIQRCQRRQGEHGEQATGQANGEVNDAGIGVGIVCVASQANSMGVAMMGGASMDEALAVLKRGEADTLVVLENDLYRYYPQQVVDEALKRVRCLIVIDHQCTALMEKAHLVISAASFAESDGTLVNNEGRAQRFFQVFDPAYYDKRPIDENNELIKPLDTVDKRSVMLESWRWLSMLAGASGGKAGQITLDQVVKAVAAELPEFAGIVDAAPDAGFRVKGMKIARQPARYSGRTSMRSYISIHEQRQPEDKDTAMAFSMEGYSGADAHRQEIPFAWAPGWNSSAAWNRFQSEVGGPLRAGDAGKRLFGVAVSGDMDVNGEAGLAYFVPQAKVLQSGWMVAPYYHLFGSEELSQRSEVIQQRMPEGYVALGEEDAKELGVAAGSWMGVKVGGMVLRLPVRISAHLKPGLVGLPVGLPGIPVGLAEQGVEALTKLEGTNDA